MLKTLMQKILVGLSKKFYCFNFKFTEAKFLFLAQLIYNSIWGRYGKNRKNVNFTYCCPNARPNKVEIAKQP